MFRKYDGGIRVCSRKTVLNRNVFLTTPIEKNRVLGDGIYAMQYYSVRQNSVSKLIWQISSNNHSNVLCSG